MLIAPIRGLLPRRLGKLPQGRLPDVPAGRDGELAGRGVLPIAVSSTQSVF